MGTVALGSSYCGGKGKMRGFECKRDGPGQIAKTFWASIDCFTCKTGIITSAGPLPTPRAGTSSSARENEGQELTKHWGKPVGHKQTAMRPGGLFPHHCMARGTILVSPKTRSRRSTRKWLPSEERVKNRTRIATVKLTEWTGIWRNDFISLYLARGLKLLTFSVVSQHLDVRKSQR